MNTTLVIVSKLVGVRCGTTFKMWKDLISGNYENYNLLPEDDPYEECYNWFWTSINLDETYPKEFLEYLSTTDEGY